MDDRPPRADLLEALLMGADDCGTLPASVCLFPPLLEVLLMGADDLGTLPAPAREDRDLGALAPSVVVEDDLGTLPESACEERVLGALAPSDLATAAPPPPFVRRDPLDRLPVEAFILLLPLELIVLCVELEALVRWVPLDRVSFVSPGAAAALAARVFERVTLGSCSTSCSMQSILVMAFVLYLLEVTRG